MIKLKKSLKSTVQILKENSVIVQAQQQHKNIFLSLFLALFLGIVPGCSSNVTFPSDTIVTSVQSICKDLYSMDVSVALNGNTLGAMYYSDAVLSDDGSALSEKTQKDLDHLVRTITRVALSTDRKIDFTIVSIRGRRELFEFTLVRYMDDIRRAYSEALSVTESMSRTVFRQLRYNPKEETKDYAIEDLTLPNFLREQILQRTRFGPPAESGASEEESKQPKAPEELFDGRFSETLDGRVFEFTVLSFKDGKSEENMRKMLNVIRDVFKGYRFKGYDRVVIRDLLGGSTLTLERDILDSYILERVSEQELLETWTQKDQGRRRIFKNALEIFGLGLDQKKEENQEGLPQE